MIASWEIRSLITTDAKLELSLTETSLSQPGPGEVVVRVEAAPINPSDLFLLTGPFITDSVRYEGTDDRPVLRADIAPGAMPSLAARVGQSLAVGNEGAGTVVAAGPGAEHLLGRVVTLVAGGMYAQYRKMPAGACHVLPDGVKATQGASAYVNPMTALSIVETMRRGGFEALINTAAASSLGQMINRLCLADGIPLVNVVRTAEQRQLLLNQGAVHVVDSSTPEFEASLVAALAATGARVAFDAVGGGRMADILLTCMERVEAGKGGAYNRYGSAVLKQVHIYGVLDPAPSTLVRRFGFAWNVGGWLLTHFLQQIGTEATEALRRRAIDEVATTFATSYAGQISLAEALRPPAFDTYSRRSTGSKYLIAPQQ